MQPTGQTTPRLRVRALRLGAAAVIGGFAFALVSAPGASARYGDLTHKQVVATNKRYSHDCFWQGPRGRDYAKLPNAQPIQQGNLYPDGNAAYWIANFEGAAEGTRVKLRGRYPHARYMAVAVQHLEADGSVSASPTEHAADSAIKPDRRSANPAVAGHARRGEKRNYTITLIADDPPPEGTERPPNTFYIGADGTALFVYRVVQPDIGHDGSGGVGLPSYTARRPDGERLQGDQVCGRVSTPLTENAASLITPQQWFALTHLPGNDPDTAPAKDPSIWEKFFSAEYSIAGQLLPTRPPADSGHNVAGANPDTTFLLSFINRQFGPVYVIHGKMPSFPDTFAGRSGARMQRAQVRYWELCQNDSPPSGKAYACLMDFQVPVDRRGNYTIVVSRRGDRPRNAQRRCGVAWLDWGSAGDGVDDPQNRPDMGMLLMRFALQSPRFKHGGRDATDPGTEQQVMGRYFPQGVYDTTDQFAHRGCKGAGK